MIPQFLKFLKTVGRTVACSAALLVVANGVHAQEKAAEPGLQERIERLEKQNQELLQTLRTLQSQSPASLGFANQRPDEPAPVGKEEVQKIVGDYLKDRD